MTSNQSIPLWSWLAPAGGVVVAFAALTLGVGSVLAVLATLALVATVFAAVFHAELVAHRVGEPFGTLVLAVAVTVIEVALIVSMMLAAPEAKAGVARDTVFAAVMIVCNGIVGLGLLAGGMRHHEQGFQLKGASSALAVLAALTVLTMVLPNVTTSVAGPRFTALQLAFAGCVSLVLYATFVFVQTIRHRDYFLPEVVADEDAHASPPTTRQAIISLVWLIVALVVVVGLAKLLTPTIEAALNGAGAPRNVIGIAIAALVLLPEGVAALRAARANRLQTCLNLALGSALASIGLTIPAVAIISIAFDLPVDLGLADKDEVLLGLTLLLGVITLGTGRTTVLQGVVHLVVFASFIFFAFSP